MLYTFVSFLQSSLGCFSMMPLYILQVTVTATDNVSPNPQVSSATVFVNVLRDLFSPRFTNIPTTINVNERAAVNTTVFTATATDQDLKQSIVYEIVGLFPTQSFFVLDSSNGRIILRNSLLSDSLQTQSYTVCIVFVNDKMYTYVVFCYCKINIHAQIAVHWCSTFIGWIAKQFGLM